MVAMKEGFWEERVKSTRGMTDPNHLEKVWDKITPIFFLSNVFEKKMLSKMGT